MAEGKGITAKSENGAEPRSILDRMIEQIRAQRGGVPPSAEHVVGFVQNVLRCPRSHQLRRLAVTAVFQVIGRDSGRVRRLIPTVATQPQIGLQIECDDPDRGISVYCHSQGTITRAAVDTLLAPSLAAERPAHVIFVTTDPIDPVVQEYAVAAYHRTGGIEVAILDCIGFVRHFLHLFHRHRTAFLDAYQALVLAEPDSAVSFALKQAFLALRQAATVAETET